MSEQHFSFEVPGQGAVDAILQRSVQSAACLVFAHGAGAGMDHAFMRDAATGMEERGIASLRYQFPFMQNATRRPDRPPAAHATVRAAVAAACAHAPDLPLFAGGKSFGGRMTSQAQALAPLPTVAGLFFFGFPLHPPGKPSSERGAHLSEVLVPMLFLQGTRDKLAEEARIRKVVDDLPRATLVIADQADHSFHVPVRSGRTDAQVLDDMLGALSQWVGKLA